jgi:hypothetical protein
MTIRRVFPLWPGLEPLRSHQAGRFEAHVVTQEQADQFILFSDDWLQPYWPGEGKTWLWGEGEAIIREGDEDTRTRRTREAQG